MLVIAGCAGKVHFGRISAWTEGHECEWCRLCPNSTGADIRSVCTEAGMFAIRARRKTVTEKDFLDAVNKVKFPGCGHVKFMVTVTLL